VRNSRAADFLEYERRYGKFGVSRVKYKDKPRRTADVLLLSIWIFGYSFLIRTFNLLQRLERLLAGSGGGVIKHNS